MSRRAALIEALLRVERAARDVVASAAGQVEEGLVAPVAGALDDLDRLRASIEEGERAEAAEWLAANTRGV